MDGVFNFFLPLVRFLFLSGGFLFVSDLYHSERSAFI